VRGTVFDIRRFSIHDGPGIRTTVFLKGCPISCLWCQNPEGRSIEPVLWYFRSRCIRCGDCVRACPTGALSLTEGAEGYVHIDRAACTNIKECVRVCPTGALTYVGEEKSVEEVMAEVRKDRLFYEESKGGITLSGGDPLYQPDFSAAILGAARAEGIHTVMETCLFAATERLLAFLPLVDIFLADIKFMDPIAHKKGTGADNGLILANFSELARRGASLVARVPLIPGHTANEENLRAIGAFVRSRQGPDGRAAGIPIELINWNPLARDKYRIAGEAFEFMDATRSYPEEDMARFRAWVAG
jgi:pyruvate formate lyase activating enzyme